VVGSTLGGRQLSIRGLVILLSLCNLAGCVTTTIQEVRQARTGITASDSIVILGRHQKGGETVEAGFVQCVSSHLDGGKLAIVSERAFIDALFPWFEPRTAPMETSDLPAIIQHPLLADKLASIGVRYVVWVDGSTRRTDSSGSMSCTIATAGIPACFGFLSWENNSSYEAQIWDIREGTQVGKVSSEAVGTSFVPAVIAPVPLIARVQTGACTSLADELRKFIAGES
jgi:hypothetical protein